jgi:hypothetical protein
MKKARLKYYESYKTGGTEREGVAVEIMTDSDGWGLDCFFPLVAKIGADKVGADGEADYIHWRILRKIGELLALGYTITKIDI